MKTQLKQIHELAFDIMWSIDGLLDGDKVERTIFKKAKKIATISEKK